MRTLALIFNRVAWFFPTVLGLMIITFMISHIIPADPVAFAAGENATAEQIAALRHELGFDRPAYVQLYHYIAGLLHGDLGTSLYTQREIATDLSRRLPATLELTFVAVFTSILVGIPLGVLSALHRNSLLDHALRIITVMGIAIASFWLAIQLQLLFSLELGWAPLHGRAKGWGPDVVTGFFIIDSIIAGDMKMLGNVTSHMVLPLITLAVPALATIVRFTRAGVLDAINSNYVAYQQAMGIPSRVIIWKYLLRNALIGTVTQIGLIFGVLITGSIVVESVFDWPGIGIYAVQSILLSDYNAIMGFTLVVGIIFIIVNLLVDILQRVIDPREIG